MVEVTDLHMHFGAVRALNGVSFVAPDGAITGLLGENGAGKTTTLNIVSGLHQAMRGSVALDGTAGDPFERRRHVGALLDQKGLYPRLTARENVAYFGTLRGFTGTELTRRVNRALAAVGIESLAERQTQGFSQGERMKVALARAIVHEPRNLILDEPTNGLDVPSARTFKAALSRMRELGVCIVFRVTSFTTSARSAIPSSSSRAAGQLRRANPKRCAGKQGAARSRRRSWR